MIAGLSSAIFVLGESNSARSASLRSSRGIYIRARLSACVTVLALSLALFASLAHPAPTNAATSDTVNFQAKLMTSAGAIAADGYYNVEFKLYSVNTGGTALWTETWYDSNGATAGNDNRVRVANGYLTVNLGAQNPFPSNINWAQNLYVTMNIGGATQTATPTWDGEMTPRLKLTAVPYAFSAGNLSNVSGAGFNSTLVFQGASGQNQVIQIPDNPLHATDDLCLYSLGNCAGTGGGITGAGTQNYVARFDSSGSHIGNSFIFDNGTFLGINTATNSGGLVNIQGSSTSAFTTFTQAAASATVATSVIQQSSGQTGNLIEFRDSNGNVNSSINATGNILNLGRVAGSGTVSQGKIVLADGTTDNYSLTLQTGTLTANSTVTIPNAGGNDTVCLLSLANCTGTGGGIAGSGTQNYLAKFDTLGGNHVGSASLFDDGNFVGLNTTTNSGLLSIQGSGTTQSSLFVQAAASASAPTIAIKQATTQTGSLLQLVDTNGNPLGGFAASGNLFYANSGFTTTLGTATLTANRSISLPNEGGTLCIQGSVNCGFELTGSNNFIQNQTASNQTAGFKITGNGTLAILTANTSVMTSLIDTPSNGGTLALGTTNATGGINLNQDTTIAVNKSINFATGTGNFDMHLSNGTLQTGTGNVTLNGTTTAVAGITLTSAGAFATQKGTDYSTVGTTNNVALGNAGLYRLTGASAQTITGIAGGTDGRQLTLVNAAAQAATISNNSASSSATNRIITGTGSDIVLPAGASISLIYDTTAGFWRVTSGVAAAGGVGVNTVGAIGAATANGATITGTTLNLAAADASNGGVVTNGIQSFGGAKTFAALITGNAGITITGGTNSLQGNTTIATTAGNTLSLGNATGALTLTGNSSSTFVINGSTVDATEFTYLDGKNAALVDLNDAVNTAITGTGALTTGSIASGFGTISTANNITTSANISTTGTGTITSAGLLTASNGLTISAGNITQSGTGTFSTGTGAISLNGDVAIAAGKNITFGATGNFDQSASSGTFKTGTGAVSLNGSTTASSGLTLTNAGSLATQKSADYSTTGSTNNVNLGAGSLVRLTGASAQTITGISGGADGRLLTIVNAGTTTATLADNSASSSATNRITTGTGGDISLPVGSSLTLIYDSGASLWRATSAAATTGGSGTNTIGVVESQTKSANGAVIIGNSLYLQTADASNIGLVSTAAQTFAGLKTFSGGITSTNINTTAAQATSLGNATGALTLTGNSSSTFVINGSTVDATEFTYLDGKNAALVDLNDAVNTAITGTGALTTGSIASGFGTISTANNITSSANISTTGTGTITSAGLLTASNGLTISAGNITQSGTGTFSTGTGAISLNGDVAIAAGKNITFGATGNFDQSASSGTFKTGTGAVSLNGSTTASSGLTLTNAGSLATQKSADYSTTGSTNNVNLGAGSLVRLTGASAQTITGISGGADGRLLTIVNAGTTTATLADNSASSSATNRITTGTGGDISLPVGSSLTLIYDSGASLWRATSAAATTGGSGTNTIGVVDSQTKSANGAVIVGNSLYLQTADASNIGLVSTAAQTFAGLKTFSGGITSTNINTTAAQATSLGNATGALTLTGNSSSTFVINGSTVDATEFTYLDGKNAALVDLNDAVNTAITGTGALTTGSIASGFGTISTANNITTSANISTTGTGTITSAGLLTASNGLTISPVTSPRVVLVPSVLVPELSP